MYIIGGYLPQEIDHILANKGVGPTVIVVGGLLEIVLYPYVGYTSLLSEFPECAGKIILPTLLNTLGNVVASPIGQEEEAYIAIPMVDQEACRFLGPVELQ